MRRSFLIVMIGALLSLSLAGCNSGYARYQRDSINTFDTHIMALGYARSQAEFDQWAAIIHGELHRLHMLYDIYNDYEGVNNLKTINDNAGIAPVKVDQAVIDLLEFAESAYHDSGGAVNIALGSVLSIWHRHRQEGIASPETASLPSMELLTAAMAHTNIADIVIDRENSTVFLRDSEMSLDVGALAKGFALQSAMEMARANGFSSGLINGGGDISLIGAPKGGREHWMIGVRNPVFVSGDSQADSLYDTLMLSGEMAVATSGDYLRYYIVDGRQYSHIIDPDTLMPADRYLSVTVVHPNAGTAEMLSTAAFILPHAEGARLLEYYDAQAIWILSDGSAVTTAGYSVMSQRF